MKRFKKIIGLLLVSALVLGLMGCGQNADKKDSEETTQTAESTTAGETSAEETTGVDTSDPNKNPNHPTSKYDAIDMGGRVFKIAYHWDIPDTFDPAPDPATATPEAIGKYENLKRVEEKYNCRIDYINVPWDQIAEQLTTSVMAGEPYADVANLPGHILISGIANNQIMKLSEVVPDNADIFNEKKVLYSQGKILGDDYVMADTNVPLSGHFIGYNKNIINTLGMDDPRTLYDKGEWNWDNFMKIARAAKKDTNGDGTIDQWGYSGTPLNFALQLIAANDGFLVDDINKKQGLDNPKTMEALEFVYKMYNVDKVAYMFENNDWNGNFNAYQEGKSAMFYAATWMWPENLGFEYGIVPFPKGPSNTSGTQFFLSIGGPVIPRGVEKPEWAYIIFEETTAWFGDDYSLKEQGTLDWLKTKYLTEEDVQLSIDVSRDGGKIDLNDAIPNFPIGNVVTQISYEGKTVAQSVEANKQIAQDTIDAVFGKK